MKETQSISPTDIVGLDWIMHRIIRRFKTANVIFDLRKHFKVDKTRRRFCRIGARPDGKTRKSFHIDELWLRIDDIPAKEL